SEVVTLREVSSLPVSSMSFSPDSQRLAVATDEERFRIWNLNDAREEMSLYDYSGAVSLVSFAPDGKTVATAGSTSTITLWDAVTGQQRTTLQGTVGKVNGLSFAPDGKFLAAADAEGVKFWWSRIEPSRNLLNVEPTDFGPARHVTASSLAAVK